MNLHPRISIILPTRAWFGVMSLVSVAVLVCIMAGATPANAQQQGVWSATGSLGTGRYSHTSNLLANGKVLVVGGVRQVTLSRPALPIFTIRRRAAANLYIAESLNHRIRKVNPAGLITTAAGVGIGGYGGDGGLATAALINSPTGVAVDGAGNLYIADTGNSRVRRVGNAMELPLVTDIRFDPFNVRIQSSFSATFVGTNLTDQTYFDVRFQLPGSNTDQVAMNWQRGTAAAHSVPSGTDAGTWTITGVRPHQTETDHTGSFIPVSATITVSP